MHICLQFSHCMTSLLYMCVHMFSSLENTRESQKTSSKEKNLGLSKRNIFLLERPNFFPLRKSFGTLLYLTLNCLYTDNLVLNQQLQFGSESHEENQKLNTKIKYFDSRDLKHVSQVDFAVTAWQP